MQGRYTLELLQDTSPAQKFELGRELPFYDRTTVIFLRDSATIQLPALRRR